ncbi:MAG: hypothetical protein HC812_16450 [Leptolyngbya sp. RL_3_1]|nr:hypothetical protein [Leptolyngbya sp. RL_3_1]
MEPHRPLSITVIAIAQLVISTLSLVAGLILVLIVTGQIQVLTSDVTVFPLPLKALVGLGLAISVLGLTASVGLWQMQRWGWIVSLVFQGLCILNNAVGVVAGQPPSPGVYASVSLSTAMIVALCAPSVQDRFFPVLSK